MKEKLIDKLFEEFEKDKETIKNNLLETMNVIILQANNKISNIKLMISYEENSNDEDRFNI
jgi:hypothetical protein